jgi:hypothetical protein
MTAADRLYERIRHDRELQSLVIEAAAEDGGPFGGAITHVTECVADVLSESAREMEHNRRMIRQSAEDTQLASDLYEAWSSADQEASLEDVAEARWPDLTHKTKARLILAADAIRKTEGACVDCRDERWTPVDDWPEYEVSTQGRVRRVMPGKGTQVGRTIGYAAAAGYRMATLQSDGRRAREYVHRLVLKAFGPPQPSEKHEVNHIDGDKTNNHIDNLEWVTRSENELHAFRIGLKSPTKGMAIGTSKLTRAAVIDARRRRENGETYTSIADDYGVHSTQILRVVSGERWSHVEEGCCVECGDDYGEAALDSDGRCEGCVHERDGLCRCGNEARPGSSMCEGCAYETAGCERFHAAYEEGRL